MFDLFGNPVAKKKQCHVSIRDDMLELRTPYNSQFVVLIKHLPVSARRFDPNSKTWLVDIQYGKTVREWILQCYGEDIGDITINLQPPPIETKVCDVWYLGRTKPVGDEWVANGMNSRKEWIFIFPERVLRDWFEGTTQLTNTTTLYSVLGIQRTATDEEIKFAYRRMVKQWHPDICKEPNAHEMFIRIKEAYDILGNPNSRAKYNAGLVLEASLKRDKSSDTTGYRAPLRCGYILADGYERLGRFVVQKIIKWEDIVTEKGTLVASWPPGAKEPSWSWV